MWIIQDMRKRVKIASILVFGALGLLACASGWLIARSGDISATDTSDLLIDSIEVSEADNSYTWFRKAAGSLKWPQDDFSVYRMIFGDQWDDERAAELLSQNTQALAALTKGLTCPAYQPNKMSESRAGDPLMLWSRDAGELMALKAAQQRRMGRTEDAWQSGLDLLRFGSLITMCPRCMVECMAGMRTLNLGLDEVERLLCGSGTGETKLVRLLERLSQIGSLDHAWATAARMEFQSAADAIDDIASSTRTHALFDAYVFQPNRTKDTFAQFYRAMIANASCPYGRMSLPQTVPIPPKGLRRSLSLIRRNNQGYVLASMLLPSGDRMDGFRGMKCATQSRLDALRLIGACRIYELRHGRLPDTLDTLVPALLREVPRDPFDGQPFRYLPREAVVYCVGRDSQDSTQSTVNASSSRPRRRTDDLVFKIHPQAR